MSYESDECKLLIDEAIHNYFHDDTETEMDVKDCFFEIREQAAKADEYEAKAKAWDEFIENINKSVDEYQGMFNESGFVHYLDGVEIHEGLLDVANQTLEKYESGESDA